MTAPLVARALDAAARQGVSDQCAFQTVDKGPLTFADQSFDIIVIAVAVTQAQDKEKIFNDCFRLLHPGGHLSCYDWTRSNNDYSDDMHYWFKMEGLTYALETLDAYKEHLQNCGYVDIETEDASDWYREEVGREYDLIRGELYSHMVELLGQESADHFVENWRATTIVCKKGGMRQSYSRGRRPA